MRKMKSTFALLLAAVTLPLLAQQAPPVARGFDPEKVFAAGPIDSVNVFNGNLLTTIPLGETYVVSPSLSYSFKTIHNGKTWDYEKQRFTAPVSCPYAESQCWEWQTDNVSVPDRNANAGFGWRVQFAGFVSSLDLQANAERTMFEGPDGAMHQMYDSLHDGDTPEDGLLYSRDGSYLRWRATSTSTSALDTPEGVTYEFDSQKKLISFHDQVKASSSQYVNRVDIQYGLVAGETTVWPCTNPSLSWKVTDTRGRAHFVCLDMENYDGTDRATVTDIYAAAATESGQAHFGLIQTQKTFGRENTERLSLYDPIPKTVTVPALMGVTLPDGSSYAFEYVGTAEHPGNGPGSGTGNLYSTTLPTKGSYRYFFGQDPIPGGSDDCILYEAWLNTYTTGLFKRDELDADGTLKGETSYTSTGAYGGIVGGFYQCTTEQEGPGYFQAFAPGAVLPVGVVAADNHSKTIHYYSVWAGHNRLMDDSPDGFKRVEYGLPFTREAGKMHDGMFLSTETYACTDGVGGHCDTTPFEATYVQYEVDPYVNELDIYTLDHNPRLKASETVYFGDGSKTAKMSNSDFDGLGHYRVAETSGFGSTLKRRTTVDFNPAAGSLPGTHATPLSTGPWLLNLYTNKKVEEVTNDLSQTPVASAKTEVCFDTANGFLKRLRVYAAGTTPSQKDVLTVFDNDGYGNVAAESYIGGDDPGLPGGFDTCQGSISAPRYRITHSYSFGALTRSQYDGTTFKSYDADVNVTGSISASRDTAGSQTTYTYDGLGHLTAVKPPDAAWTEYAYTLPSTSADHAAVAVRQRPPGTPSSVAALTEQRFYFDGLGRLIERKSSMPGTQWATMARTYDVMGRTSLEYAPYATSSADYDSVPAGVKMTQHTYGDWIHPDAANRPDDVQRTDLVTLPDNSVSSIVYKGASEQDKTSSVATGYDSQADQTTKDSYDYLGRLTNVSEKGGAITAAYGYDIADHLSSVNMTGSEGAQSRSFQYDGRGFLTSETHPENGTTVYQKYDPRGHCQEKRTSGDSAFDLNMTFDSAERLTEVDSRNPYHAQDPSQNEFRVSKIFNFAMANVAATGNYAQGRLASATRHNYQPVMGDVVVAESLAWDSTGRVSKKTTAVSEHTDNSDRAINSFDQTFTYDALGNLVRAGYATCADPTKYCGGSPLAVFDDTYDKGYLASVPGFVDSISYYPTGVVKQVNHSNGLATAQAQDDTGMARIKSIKVANYGNCAAAPPVINGQPADATVNSGASTTLTVYTSGSSPAYQWYDGASGQPISGATASSYTTPALTQSASYFAVVSTPCNSVQSRTATVTVCTLPAIDVQPADMSVGSGGTATLTAHATGSPLSYQWYDATTGQAIAGATSSSFTTPVLTQTTLYYVIVSSACGSSVQSRIATVNSCAAPSLASQPPNTAVVSGNTATLTASATGGALHYHWYAGASGNTAQPVGGDAPSYTTPAITSVSQYWVQVTNACGSANGSTLTLSPVVAPSYVTATYSDTTHISVTWPAASNAAQYRLMRREAGTSLRAISTFNTSTTTVTDTVTTNAAYLYCVQAFDTAGAATPCSTADVGSTRLFSAIAAGQPIYAAQFQQILDGINAVYDIVGATHVGWANVLPATIPAPAPNVPIFAQHVTSLRAAVAVARAAVAQSTSVAITAVVYNDPQLTSGAFIRAVHVQDLQGGLK
jgi:YD repeat-containing protein